MLIMFRTMKSRLIFLPCVESRDCGGLILPKIIIKQARFPAWKPVSAIEAPVIQQQVNQCWHPVARRGSQ